MHHPFKNLLAAVLLLFPVLRAGASDLRSVYTQCPEDPEAAYFVTGDTGGKTDVSDALQEAINRLKREKNFGILFIPEGKYRISRTIYVPSSIRLIGYGKHRPEFILTKNAPGFQEDVPGDKGHSRYMFWFTGGIVRDGDAVNDAGAGTFYSAMSNIDLRIEDGNPAAIALRTHYAQHSFVSHMAIRTGKGRAGLFDVGNEMENLAFFGGEYGILTTKASPGWQVMMTDCSFEGQRSAAIRSQESGLAMVNVQVKDVPSAFWIEDNYWEKLFVENGRFENITGPLVRIAVENNSNTSITFRNLVCDRVPVLAAYPRTGEEQRVAHRRYRVVSFDHGLQMDSLTAVPAYATRSDIRPLDRMPAPAPNDVPSLPEMDRWVNVASLGVVGDGTTDVTDLLQEAVDRHDVLYFPTGWYRLTRTLRLRPESKLIGLHPFATQLCLSESTPAFSGFGTPVPVLESSRGGDNVLNGIGINTGAYNYRAVGVKWMAGADSYLNDVKFVGGHGGLWKPVPGQEEPRWWGRGERRISSPSNPVRDQGMDQAWDRQYWSLWVTDGGGGTIKDVWTASTYATSGFYAEHTSTPARIYAMSIEHHVRNEVRFNDVHNWKVYCMQTEEESVESIECQPIEMDACSGMTFANLYMFRVIRVNRPYRSSVRIRGCRDLELLNVHNYSQIKYTTDLAVFDQDKGVEVRPWEFSRLVVRGDEAPAPSHRSGSGGSLVADDFEFTEGSAHDSKGRFWFCEHRTARLWRWSEEEGLSLVADFPWHPYNVAFDTEDNILVTFRYDRQPGFGADPADVALLPDAGGTSFSGWGNSGYAVLVYTFDPERPEDTLRLLDRKDFGEIAPVAKALYPSNRWRDFHDYNEVAVYRPARCFVAPDGKTVIPQVYDLARSSSLCEAVPGRPFYAVNEYDRRTVRMDVSQDGGLGGLTYFVEDGEFSVATDLAGHVYVASGQVEVYAPDGEHLRTISVPERPSTLSICKDRLLVTCRSRVYVFPLEGPVR